MSDFLFTIPVYWINLDRSENRKNVFLKNNYKYFKNITRISGIDCLNMTVTLYEKSQVPLIPGELAVICSQLKAIKKAYDDKHEYVLIMEDDNGLDPIIENNIDLDKIPFTIENWDVLQLHTSNALVVEKLSNINNRLWIPWEPIHHSAGAYIIKRNMMKVLLDKYWVSDTIINTGNHPYPVADRLIYDSGNSFTIVYPLFREFENNISLIHPFHTPFHKYGTDLSKKIALPSQLPFLNKT